MVVVEEFSLVSELQKKVGPIYFCAVKFEELEPPSIPSADQMTVVSAYDPGED